MKEINPSPDYILVEMPAYDATVETDSGILVNRQAIEDEEPLRTQKVLAVGINAREGGYRVGDNIVFSRFATLKYKHEGRELAFLNYEDVIARV